MIFNIDKFYEKFLINKFFFYFFLFFFFLSPHLKFLNLELNIFDTGLYASNLYSIHHLNNFNGIFIGHFQPILILLSKIHFITDKYSINILLFLQSVCLISPIFFLKNSLKLKLIYLLSFPVWYINFNGFHTDSLIIPFLYLALTLKSNFRYLCIISFLLIKEIYILLAISIIIYEIIYKKNENRIINILILFFLLVFSIFVFEIIYIENKSIFSIISNEIINFESYFNKIFFLTIIFIPYLFINFKYKLFYFIYFPITSVYLLFGNINYLKPYFHYSCYLIPCLFVFCKNEINNSKKYFTIYITLNLIFTINFLNPLFYSSKIKFVENYNYKNYIYVNRYFNFNNFIKDLNLPDNEAILVSNDLLHPKIVKRNFILVPEYLDYKLYSYTSCKNLYKKTFDLQNKKKCKVIPKIILLNKMDYLKYKNKLSNKNQYKIIKQNNDFIFIKSKGT